MTDIAEEIKSELSEIHTCLPGKIMSWDGSLAVVKPAMPIALSSGDSLPAPQIVSVPVCFPTGLGGSAMISVPLQAGDDVLLHFSEDALENWLSGSDEAPTDPRRFDLSDCFASPMVRPGVGVADTANLRLICGSASMTLAPSGEVTIIATNFKVDAPESNFTGNSTTIGQITGSGGMAVSGGHGVSCEGDIDIRGGVTATDDVTAGGISLMGHTHTGDSGGTTSAPK